MRGGPFLLGPGAVWSYPVHRRDADSPEFEPSGAGEPALIRFRHLLATLFWMSSVLVVAERLRAEGPPADPPTGGPTPLPPAEALEAAGARIGTISIRAGDVFNLETPGERKRLFRWANFLHRDTRERILERLLLFAPGDRYSASVVAESARLLRAQRYLAEAEIRLVAFHDGVVDVEVRTRDNWSLKPSLNFGRSGGANHFKISLQESNFLGWGKDLQFERSTDVDRSSTLLSYEDSSLFGSRLRGKVVYADNSDGRTEQLQVELPFYSLASRRAGGFALEDDRRSVSLYTLGRVRTRFEQRRRFEEAWVGLSSGLVDGETYRWRYGVTAEELRFSDLPGETSPTLPPDRTLVYPWVEWVWLEDRFVVEHDFDRVGRTEDLALGWQGSARLGVATERLGSDRDAVLYRLAFSRGLKSGEKQLLLAATSLEGRVEARGGPALFSSSLRYLYRDFAHQAFYVAASFDAARQLDAERQLLLGGDNGLRGYPLRYAEGDRRALLTVEQRWYGEREFFHLVRLGAAVFGDAGRAWFAGPDGRGGLGWLRDLGVGLRLASTRTSHANVVRLDIAFPLDGGPSIDRVQYLVSTSERF